jgi:D-alanine-D-alanine ligase-like ATP-grasp enzyme
VEKAFAEGHEVLVESFMKGTEVACGVVKTAQKKDNHAGDRGGSKEGIL